MSKKWKVILLLFFSIIVILLSITAVLKMNTKKHSPIDTISFNEHGLNIKMVYCRPYKNGRLIFGKAEDAALQPFGQYWRMGANDATTFEVNKDVTFAGKPLKAGKYSIYAIPGEKAWEIAINKNANHWGKNEPNHDNDVLVSTVPVTYSDQIIEQFIIEFSPIEGGAEVVLKWDTSVVRIAIK